MRIAHPLSIVFQLGIGSIIAGATAFVGHQVTPDGGAWAGVLPLIVTLIVTARKPLRRWRAVRESMPERWKRWLTDHLPYYRRLSPERQERFDHDVQIFLAEQTIEGIAGVEVSDRYRLALASAAAMLLNGHVNWDLPDTRTFLLYPANFNEEYLLEDTYTDAPIMGRAHGQGPIILAVPAVEAAIEDPTDGQNIMLHELTHLLDFENLLASDRSPDSPYQSRREIERLLDQEMEKIEHGASILGSYAAQNPAEFLAVATERFFEQPNALQRRHPELYELLCTIYNQDPTRTA